MEQTRNLIPQQTGGRQTDFSRSIMRGSIDEAHKLFKKATERLLNISNWREYAAGSLKFGLTDQYGNFLDRIARKGDYFYIDMPAPGSLRGKGLEWVKIEEILNGGSKNSHDEYLLMQVRPVPNPSAGSKEVAHFFSEASTSTFVIERNGIKVSAEMHGRNERINNRNINLYDTIRNTAIALTNRIGISGPNWQKFIEGLLLK